MITRTWVVPTSIPDQVLRTISIPLAIPYAIHHLSKFNISQLFPFDIVIFPAAPLSGLGINNNRPLSATHIEDTLWTGHRACLNMAQGERRLSVAAAHRFRWRQPVQSGPPVSLERVDILIAPFNMLDVAHIGLASRGQTRQHQGRSALKSVARTVTPYKRRTP